MYYSQLFQRLGVSLVGIVALANATYTIQDTYDMSNFFNEFKFFTAPDPTAGFVKYVSPTAANASGLAGYANDAVYLGVDYSTMNPSGGRHSVRVTSNKAYTHGLFVADIAHMPGGICGVWPAFWTFGPNWPASGEIDIIEGVNDQTTDSITLHTSAGCSFTNAESSPSSTLTNTDCNSGGGSLGCGYSTANTQGYGKGFNSAGGGVYAMEWTASNIQVFFFPRDSIPEDITSGDPNPAGWGDPVARFSGQGCNIDSHFMNHNIVFDTTFCGQWAGSVWAGSSCASLASTCDAYVGSNPNAFSNAYWLINSVKVYSESSAKRGLTAVPFSS